MWGSAVPLVESVELLPWCRTELIADLIASIVLYQ